MPIHQADLNRIWAEAQDAEELVPYHAVNGLWLATIKLANLFPTVGEEHEQLAALLRRLSRDEAATILADPGVDQLLGLDPPLETMLAHNRERLQPLQAAKELVRIQKRRDGDPKAGLAALHEIIKRIRDRREHGFKTPSGSRDAPILAAAQSVLSCIFRTAHASLVAAAEASERRSAGEGG